MAFRHALASSLLAAMIVAGASEPAPAQCRLCPQPTTERSEDDGSGQIRLEASAILDFDRLVLLGAGSGAATLLPNGERSVAGNIATVSARAMVGSVTVRGERGRAIRVDLPQRIDLYTLGGARISIDEIETDLPGLPKLDPSGSFSFRFGGKLNVTGDSDGEYRGDVPITVEYL